ncbi:hypothetical protein LJB86_02575 [Deltaproteobacteria bacterium OttesenSCG-928-M10]|nr:hypothetical protein [Deltaproteobacteria bacterium OttesenSCG-928-M10]
MKKGNDTTNVTDSVHLPPLEKGLGQAAWVVAVVVALLLITGFIATWLFEHSKEQALADRAFIPLQAIFICFTAMLVVMAFQRCFWIGLTKKTVLGEAVEMGWLFGQLCLPESDWRAFIAKNRLTVFIAERPLAEPTANHIKASCFYFFKIMFGYSKLSFWASVAQKKACFLREQVAPIIDEIEAACQADANETPDRLSGEDHRVMLDLQEREQVLLRRVAEQAETVVQSTSRSEELAAQVQDLTRRLEASIASLSAQGELVAKLDEVEGKNKELNDYINQRVGGLNTEIQQKQELLEEYKGYVGKGATEKAKRAKLHRETMLLGAICLPMIERKIAEAKKKIENGCPGVKYSLRRLDRWFQEEWPKYPEYEAALLEAIASKSDPTPDLKSKKLPVLTREFLFELLREAGFAASKGEKEEGTEDELWLDDDIENEPFDD